MATKINSRTSSTTCNLYCAVENAAGTAVNVNISWSHNLSAPASIHAEVAYTTPDGGQTVRENRHYAPDGSYTPAPSYQFDLFNSTFNNALKELVLDCFDNYSNISLIGEE